MSYIAGYISFFLNLDIYLLEANQQLKLTLYVSSLYSNYLLFLLLNLLFRFMYLLFELLYLLIVLQVSPLYDILCKFLREEIHGANLKSFFDSGNYNIKIQKK